MKRFHGAACEEHYPSIKDHEEREKCVVVRDTTRGGGTEFTIGFEGSQALPVCPSGKRKLLTGNIEVQFFLLTLGAGVMKNVVFWDIKSQSVPHRRHITSLLQSTAS
jgi:hypothetical protein